MQITQLIAAIAALAFSVSAAPINADGYDHVQARDIEARDIAAGSKRAEQLYGRPGNVVDDVKRGQQLYARPKNVAIIEPSVKRGEQLYPSTTFAVLEKPGVKRGKQLYKTTQNIARE